MKSYPPPESLTASHGADARYINVARSLRETRASTT